MPAMRRFLAGLVLTPFVLAPFVLSAHAKPLLTPADYGQWQTVGQFRLSPRGDWVATGIGRVNEENELQLRGGPRDTTIIVPYATQPAFTATNAWVGYLVGVSPKKRDSLTTAKKPVRTSLVLRPLGAGAVLTEPDIQSFTFSADGRFAAATRYPAEGKRVSDIVVYDLATGSRFTLPQVSEQVWSERGSLLAVAIEGEAGSGSSVQLYDAATNTLKVLAAGLSPFRALTWRTGTRDLAVLQSRPDPAFRDTAHVVHLFSDVSASCACLPTTLDAARAVQFPQGMRIAEHRRPVWSQEE